jgi:dihydropteroate synthase
MGITPCGPGIFLPHLRSPQRTIGGHLFDFSRRVAVMAIVNRTPDSFHDRGKTFGFAEAVDAVDKAVSEGADWVDIGGVPFAPGPVVTVKEELDRVIPVVEESARRNPHVVISVDTCRPEVARHSIAAGASVINDTSGLHDPAVAEFVAGSDATLTIVHTLAAPRTVFPRPSYHDVTVEVANFLRQRVDLAVNIGVPPERIIVDPGHDLNKNTYHTLELTRRLSEITALGYPTLVAVSNKDFIGETLDLAQGQRLEGTLAAAVFCIVQGARIVRMHDVQAAVSAVRLTEAILGFRPPATARHNLV